MMLLHSGKKQSCENFHINWKYSEIHGHLAENYQEKVLVNMPQVTLKYQT